MWWSVDIREAWAIIAVSAFLLIAANAKWVTWKHRCGLFFVYAALAYSYEMTQHYLWVIEYGSGPAISAR